jgi:hypothetical protein
MHVGGDVVNGMAAYQPVVLVCVLCGGRMKTLAVAQDSHLQRVTIPEAAYVKICVADLLMMNRLRSKHVEEFNLM